MRSETVVFPASMCAAIPIFRIFVRSRAIKTLPLLGRSLLSVRPRSGQSFDLDTPDAPPKERSNVISPSQSSSVPNLALFCPLPAIHAAAQSLNPRPWELAPWVIQIASAFNLTHYRQSLSTFSRFQSASLFGTNKNHYAKLGYLKCNHNPQNPLRFFHQSSFRLTHWQTRADKTKNRK